MKHNPLQVLKLESGQSLLEITVALSVAAIAIGALTITTLIGLKNSQFSQNQVLATKYGQEELEIIRSMRDRNICVQSGSVKYFWNDSDLTLQPTLWGSDFGSQTFYLVSNPPDGVCQLTDVAPGTGTGELALANKFKRTASIINISADQKKFTVKVAWSDSSGTHQSNLETILSNY
ncbi:hypothetical protein HY025_05645 [Candidatus Daviesbacteria bacterium]|nr:hypothetical protein [Candidatus Daviesbacteria bacterium]